MYNYINHCSQSCTPGITYDENGYKFFTKCSEPVNHKCYSGRGWFFTNVTAIASQGVLQTCYSGFNYCKI